MTAIEATDLFILAGFPVLLARLFVGLTYERRTSRVWTFGLPTVALLLFFLRVAITRNLGDLVASEDWITAASWGGVVVSQLVASLYGWWPADAVARYRARKG